MKILHLIDSGGLYGAETMLLHLMEEQSRLGARPVLASIGLPSDTEKAVEAEARRGGLDVIAFRMRPGPNWIGGMQILRFARRNQVDVLHSHGYKGNILFGLMPQFFRRLPLVSTLHGWTSVDRFSRKRFYESLECLSLRFVDRVVLVNEAMREHPRLSALSPEKLVVIENGIPVEASGVTEKLRHEIIDFTVKRFTFGAIGRLSPEKGFDLLLDAFSALVAAGNEVQLIILGEGGQRALLEEKVKSLRLESHVLLPGFVAGASNYLPLFGAFVMSSLTEGLPMVLLEAMVKETPIVTTRVGGIPHVLEEGRGGILIGAGDVQALRQAMQAMLENSQATRERSVWAAKRVRECYSSRAMAEKYGQIYQKLAK